MKAKILESDSELMSGVLPRSNYSLSSSASMENGVDASSTLVRALSSNTWVRLNLDLSSVQSGDVNSLNINNNDTLENLSATVDELTAMNQGKLNMINSVGENLML